jgi:hypothetical protein
MEETRRSKPYELACGHRNPHERTIRGRGNHSLCYLRETTLSTTLGQRHDPSPWAQGLAKPIMAEQPLGSGVTSMVMPIDNPRQNDTKKARAVLPLCARYTVTSDYKIFLMVE